MATICIFGFGLNFGMGNPVGVRIEDWSDQSFYCFIDIVRITLINKSDKKNEWQQEQHDNQPIDDNKQIPGMIPCEWFVIKVTVTTNDIDNPFRKQNNQLHSKLYRCR